MVKLFIDDIEHALSIRMGGYRQKLFKVEHVLDRLFVFVHRAIVQLRHSHELSVEQLATQLYTLFTTEVPEAQQHVRKLRTGKLAVVSQMWSMTQKPRSALVSTMYSMVANQMVAELGQTEHLRRDVISVKDLREFCVVKLSAIVRRDLVRLGTLAPEAHVLSELSLPVLWRQARVAT
eukprot:4447908-Prymnesium_polylepis.1